jgi:serine-type D-Ala-D-Ala carboxypeptidase/endopeptidase (penicillin-binding protein 4)
MRGAPPVQAPFIHALRSALTALLAALLAGCGTLAQRPPDLPPALAEALARAGVPSDAFAAAALPLSGWHRPWDHRGHAPMLAASTMKLVTSAVALDRLGPNHRGRTQLLADSPVRDGVLQGPLYLRGGADTDLGTAQLWQLLMLLRSQGVQEIAGGLVIDRTLFNPARSDIGVPPFDDAPEWPYNGIPDALQLNANLIGLSLRSDAQTVQARLVPELPGVRVSSRLQPNDKPCEDWDDDWRTPTTTTTAGDDAIHVELQGQFPRNCEARADLALLDRQALADRLVRMLWGQLAGTLRGPTREGATPTLARVLAEREGRTLAEVLRDVNKQSDNPLARLLYLSLGAAQNDPALPTRAAADRAVRRWLAERRIDAASLHLDNGSGLSRSERIAPLAMAHLLHAAHAGPHAHELIASLPVAGVDGTMRTRLRDSPAAQRARIKTGTLANVVAVAGYVSGPDDRLWAVAAMINHDRARQARDVLDAFIDWVAQGGTQAGRYEHADVGGP